MGPVTVPQASVRYAPPLIETLTFRSQRPVFASLLRFGVQLETPPALEGRRGARTK